MINLTDFLEKKKHILVAVGIILLAMIIGNNSIYQVQKRKMNQLKGEIKKEEAKNRLVREITGLNKEFASYKKRLPVQRDASWLIRKVTQLAKDVQIEVISLQPKEPDRQKGYIRTPLEIRVGSSYHELGQFLSKIESSEEFIRVDSLQLTAEGVSGQISGVGGRRRGAWAEAEDKPKGPTASLVVSTIYLEE